MHRLIPLSHQIAFAGTVALRLAVYSFLFDDAQEAYNAKQKRKDRKIADYHASIREPYDAIRKEIAATQKWNDEHREEIKRGELEAKPVPEIPRSMKKPSYELMTMSFSTFYDKKGRHFADWELGGRVYEHDGVRVEETLYCEYKDKNCENRDKYFLRIKTGTKSPAWKVWGERTRNWCVYIKALSSREAKEWVRKYLDADAYEYIFDEPSTG